MTTPDAKAEPSAAAKEWYVNKVQEPLLAAGLVVPVVSTNNAKSRMLDFDAGALCERERIAALATDQGEQLLATMEHHSNPVDVANIQARGEALRLFGFYLSQPEAERAEGGE